MANYFMANTSNVDSMRHGRPQSILLEASQCKINGAFLPNATIVTLKDTMEASKGREFDHIHAVEVKALDSVVGASIIVAPEINVQQYRTIDGQIGKFLLEAEEVYTSYDLIKGDRIEYSEGYFVNIADATVGNKFNVDQNGKLVKATSNGALRVVSVKEQRLPVMLAAVQATNNNAAFTPASIKMVKLEVIK